MSVVNTGTIQYMSIVNTGTIQYMSIVNTGTIQYMSIVNTGTIQCMSIKVSTDQLLKIDVRGRLSHSNVYRKS